VKILVAPSILSADFLKLGEEIRAVEAAGADMIHVDVMDGHFVPNITIGPLVVKAAAKATKLPLDVHLMIEHPEKYIEVFAKAGANIISVQAEASNNLKRDIDLIRSCGVKPAVVINPKTPLKAIHDVLGQVSMVLIMSVNPGFEGQKFMPEVLPKVQELRDLINTKGLHLDIEIDGGINTETSKLAVDAGANVLVAGSAIYYSEDYKTVIESLKKA
jgi:ribulose-phosphate 3-epimerase